MSGPDPEGKAWAAVRLALGLAQMGGAAASVTLLARTGMNEWSLSAVALTCLLTTVSVLLFGRRGGRG
jgi:hypothetical protein